MTATWLTVDQASSRLRSDWPNAGRAVGTGGSGGLTAGTSRAGVEGTRIGNSWARTKVPAATMVAAWMSAEAGVGPSIASGSQSWNGIWADLPSTPMTSSTSARLSRVRSAEPWVQYARTLDRKSTRLNS